MFDRDSKFDAEVIRFLKSTGLKLKRTSVEAPWQSGVAERWVGTYRREVLDHVIALNEPHLCQLIRGYVSYYHRVCSAETTIVVKRPPSPSGIRGATNRAPRSSRRGDWRVACACGRWPEHCPGWVPEIQDLTRSEAGPGCSGSPTL